MFFEGRVTIVWLSWLIGGICGVVILLLIVCYCRLMPRNQKSFDEQYLKDSYSVKESHTYKNPESHRIKSSEVQVNRHTRPASYAGGSSQCPRRSQCDRPERQRSEKSDRDRERSHQYVRVQDTRDQYNSSGLLDERGSGGGLDALKTRSLPAFLRPKPRPLSTEDDLQQLYSKVNLSKKYKNRMRSEHAAIIALSKSHSQILDADAVIVMDQRTAL